MTFRATIKDFTSAEAAPREHPAPAHGVALVALAVSLGAVGLPLVLVFDGGPLLAAGVVSLLAFIALASLAIVSGLPSLGAPRHDSRDDASRI